MNLKKFSILIICLSFFTLYITQTSQAKDPTSSKNLSSREIFEQALYRISYMMTFTPDPEHPQDKRETPTVLLVGKKYSLFADFYSLKLDSLENDPRLTKENAPDQIKQLLPIGKKIKFKPWIVKNYPSKGEILFQQNFGANTYRYEDKDIKLDWQLHTTTKEIAGYRCNEASCVFRGRSYTAWYCPDFPLNAGPYVFGDLPGLIFSLHDDANEFSFQIEGIQKLSDSASIYLPDRNIVNISRKEFRQIEKNLANNPATVLNLTSGRANVKPEVLRNIKPKSYNPIEKE